MQAMNQLSLFDLPVPSMPVLDVSRCVVRPVNHLTAANMVEEYHYAHRVPAISIALGLYVDSVLGGVVTYGIPPNNMLNICGDIYKPSQLELNRLFVHSWVGRNAESFLIGRSFEYLRLARSDIHILVSYADSGMDHVGYVYQATNWIYTGLSAAGGSILVNGVRLSEKNVTNRYGTRSLVKLREMGIEVESIESTRKHRYVYLLGDKRKRKELYKALRYPVLPYPKPANGDKSND